MTCTGGRLAACLEWKINHPSPVMSDVRRSDAMEVANIRPDDSSRPSKCCPLFIRLERGKNENRIFRRAGALLPHDDWDGAAAE